MGGLPAGPVEASEHEYALWEKRVDAILSLLFKKGLMTVDEMRRNIESLGADAYDRMSYYGRWIEAGARTRAEPMPASDAVEARFRAGDRVSVREAYPLGHVRTPFYARGKSGVVERLCGFYPDPEERAYARSGLPKQPLIACAFGRPTSGRILQGRRATRWTSRFTSTGWRRRNETSSIATMRTTLCVAQGSAAARPRR